MSIQEDKIARLRGLAGQTENAMTLGMIDDVGDPELVEVVALLRELDAAGCLRAPVALTQVELLEVDRGAGGSWAIRIATSDESRWSSAGTFNHSGPGDAPTKRGILITSEGSTMLREISQVLGTAADQIDERS